MARLAVLGTGIMGGPMAHNLLRADHEVRAWNRTQIKADALAGEGAEIARTPPEAVRDAELVLTMLADAGAVEETMVESGALEAIPEGAVWIQSSTVGLAATERLAKQAEEREISFVDAPVLGTKKPAEDGQLVVLGSSVPSRTSPRRSFSLTRSASTRGGSSRRSPAVEATWSTRTARAN